MRAFNGIEVRLDRNTETVFLDDGRSFDVTNWLDWTGNECDPEHAVAFVAGDGDFWISGIIDTDDRPRRLN
jgi:hypothetical protein